MREWTVTATQDEETFFDDHIETIITASTSPATEENGAGLPPHDQSVGETAVHWDRVGNAAFIQAQGGTVDDRMFARALVAAQLRGLGIPEATQELDPFQKTADWNDIMDKARRLIQEGKVRILRNGYNNIVAWVKGDHGEYNPEIFRQDPSSRAITGSDCGCGWGEFQNKPRTRKWKKFQDRPCAHILAAYWQAQATPLDEDMAMQNAQNPQGQLFQGTPGGMGANPSQGVMQQMNAPPGQASPAPAPGQSGGQMSLLDQPSPADVLPQFQTEAPDVQQQNPASVPGLRGPTPTNPVAYPPGPGGTFSSLREMDEFGYSLVEGSEPERELGTMDFVRLGDDGNDQTTPLLEVDQQLWVVARSTDIGDHRNGLAIESGLQGIEFHGWRIADTDATVPEMTDQDPRLTTPLTNGQMVQLRYPDTGRQVGRSEGGPGEMPTDAQGNPQLAAGLVGEVLGTDPTTGMVSVLYAGRPWGQNQEMQPFGAVGEHWRSYLIHRPDVKRPGPAVRRAR